jgi:N-acetylmuramoyl-L-alanine amidase
MNFTINGGHCPGQDSGTVGSTGLQEAIVVREVMQFVAGYLRAVGHNVLEVQKNELYQITDASNRFGSDLFVSIHCNGATNTAAKGAETWYNDGSVKGQKLAACIQNQIISSIHYPDGKPIVDRGVKAAVPGVNGLYVLRYTDCPAALVEMAFLSNQEDEKLLADAGTRDKFARAIARGITDYLIS